MIDREPWMAEALCYVIPFPAEWWFKKKYEAVGKLVCINCPVKDECLEFAVREHMEAGLWGGVGERERRLLVTH